MRRNNEKCKVSVYNTGRGITSQALLYQHMSNHYRRILNAQKAVDTAPPVAYKPKRSTKCSVSSSPVRSFVSNNKRFSGRNVSPALTERTVSNYSHGGCCWGVDACTGRKCDSSRNNECCCRGRPEISTNNSDMELINQIAFDTKRGPANCFDPTWKNAEQQISTNRFRSPYEVKKPGTRNLVSSNTKKPGTKSKLLAGKRKLPHRDKAASDLMEKHSKFFISHNNSFCPRILKTNATSKVKSLKVYHPPRKKTGAKRASEWKEEVDEGTEENKSKEMMKSNCSAVPNVCQHRKDNVNCKCKEAVNVRETSQTSSRDSAYNGGVSSLPESRSPTPDQRKEKTCCCHRKESDNYYHNVRTENENIVVPNLKLMDNQDTQTESSQTSERKVTKSESPRSECCENGPRAKHLGFKEENKNPLVNEEERDYFKRKIKEEALYTGFIRDITAEVLEKGLYTNKALKKVMKRHVVSNLWLLDKDRMLKEIEKLRIQLGIPEDEDLLDLRVESAGSTADIDECYSIISDSELTESGFCKKNELKQKNVSNEDSSIRNWPSQSERFSPTSEKVFPKSISDVLNLSDGSNEIVLDTDSEDDEELISVIHVTKLVKDKKRNDPNVKELYSEPSRNQTQGNSADESEQSSDHVTRKKKLYSRYRKVEKTSSSSDDPETSKPVEGRRYYGARADHPRLDSLESGNSSSPKRSDITAIAKVPAKDESKDAKQNAKVE